MKQPVSLIWFLLAAGVINAAPADTLTVTEADTAAVVDSIAPGKDRKAALTDSVTYGADTIRFLIDEEVIRLTGRANVSYQGITLTAHAIILYSATRNLKAAGRPTVTDGDTVWTGLPVLTDHEGRIEGFRMVYNLESRRGKITRGSTAIEKGHYDGSTVALVGDKELNTQNGNYTTCAMHEDPHYTFHSKRMKLYINDKAILKPVTLTFQEVPVLKLPFFILPLKHNRHSGLLMPKYGEDNLYGKYLKNIGYYYAPSPYWDAKLAMGFYSSARNQAEAAFRYNLRYVLNGSISSSLLYDAGSNGSERRWDLKFNHSHELAPGWSMRAYGTFVSDRDYFNDYRETIAERSERDLRSGAYLTRRGEKTTTTVTLLHNKRFLTDRTTTDITLPQLTFRAGGQVFPAAGSAQSPRQEWYRKLRYSYSNSFKQTLHRQTDSTLTDTGAYDKTRQWTQNSGINYSGTLLVPWLNITPGLTYNETYTYYTTDSNSQQGTYSLKTGVNTTLYGLFPVGLFSLEALRHTLSPSVSVSYTRTLRGTDRPYRPLAPGTPDEPVRSLGVGLSNLFQAKVQRDSSFDKPTLLTGPNINSSYNFETKQWGNVTTSMSTALGRLLSVNVRFSHSLYGEGSSRLRAADGLSPLRELSRTITLRINGNTGGTLPYYDDIRRFSTVPGYAYAGTPVTTVTRPWKLAAGYTVVRNRTPTYSSETRNLTGSAGLSLTRNLSAAYTATYNLEEYEFVTQRVELQRDLHCWEARLNWTPTGYRKGFYFRVNIREIPDVKVEQSINYN